MCKPLVDGDLCNHFLFIFQYFLLFFLFGYIILSDALILPLTVELNLLMLYFGLWVYSLRLLPL